MTVDEMIERAAREIFGSINGAWLSLEEWLARTDPRGPWQCAAARAYENIGIPLETLAALKAGKGDRAMKRWCVIILYRTDGEPLAEHHYVEELSEIEEIVESGPDWNAIMNISVQINRVTDAGRTISRNG